MFYSNSFRIVINKSLFRKEKKNIFLVIRKSPGEYDFIASVLNHLKNDHNIFTIFNDNRSYIRLKNNNFLFGNWKKISFGYIINKDFRLIHLRVFYKILNILKFKSLKKYKSYLDKNYYNLNVLKSEILKKIGLEEEKYMDGDILFCSLQNKTGWINEFKKNRNKIIYFPEKSNLEQALNTKTRKIKLNNKILSLLPNKDSYMKYKNHVELGNIVYCGFPKFSKNWIKLFLKKPKKKTKNKVTIFYKTFESDLAYDKEKYLHQLKTTISLLKKYNYSINFNLHPIAKIGFENYFNGYERKNFKISKNNITQDIFESDLLIFKYATNSILDCVAHGKYPLELWSLKYKKYFKRSIYSKKRLTLNCNNPTMLEKYIKESLKKIKYPKIDERKKKYFLNENENRLLLKKIKNFINY